MVMLNYSLDTAKRELRAFVVNPWLWVIISDFYEYYFRVASGLARTLTASQRSSYSCL
jgi:hypothetical protein